MEKEQLITDAQTPLSVQSKSKSTKSAFEIEEKLNAPPPNNNKRKKENKPTTCFGKFIDIVDKYYMLWMLLIVIPVAAVTKLGHNDGPLHPRITSSWMMTTLLFFGIGLLIKIEYLQRAVYFWQMIIFAHIIIFIYWPVLGWTMYQVGTMIPNISDSLKILLNGIIVLCCLPATASSATVFTMNVDANEAASAVNCTLSNLIAIMLTPGLILVFTGSETSIDAGNIFMNLSLRVVAPFIVAQVIRCGVGKRGRKKIKKLKKYIKKFNETAILYMVFCALSESFYVGIDATYTDAFIFLAIIEVMHVHGYFAIYFYGKMFERCMAYGDNQMAFTIKDNVAIVYTGVSKSIAMGVPFIEMIYEGDPNAGFYLLPILCYHPSNLIWGSIFSQPLRSLITRNLAKYSSLMLSMMASTMTTMQNLDPDWSPDPPGDGQVINNENNENSDTRNAGNGTPGDGTPADIDYGAMDPVTPMNVGKK